MHPTAHAVYGVLDIETRQGSKKVNWSNSKRRFVHVSKTTKHTSNKVIIFLVTTWNMSIK